MPHLKHIALLLSLLLLLSACGSDEYRPPHLHQLDREEILARAFRKEQRSPYVVFRDSTGQPLSDTLKDELNKGQLQLDQYADKSGEVKEIVVRHMTADDELWSALTREAFIVSNEYSPQPVDCRQAKRILLQLHKKVELARELPNSSIYGIYNDPSPEQSLLMSLIQRCGFPRKSEVTENGLIAIYSLLIFEQRGWLAALYPQLKKSAERGDMSKKYLAYLEDEVLAFSGFPQRYGTFYGRFGTHSIRDSLQVDERRAAMGLPPLAEEPATRQQIPSALPPPPPLSPSLDSFLQSQADTIRSKKIEK